MISYILTSSVSASILTNSTRHMMPSSFCQFCWCSCLQSGDYSEKHTQTPHLPGTYCPPAFFLGPILCLAIGAISVWPLLSFFICLTPIHFVLHLNVCILNSFTFLLSNATSHIDERELSYVGKYCGWSPLLITLLESEICLKLNSYSSVISHLFQSPSPAPFSFSHIFLTLSWFVCTQRLLYWDEWPVWNRCCQWLLLLLLQNISLWVIERMLGHCSVRWDSALCFLQSAAVLGSFSFVR